MARLGFLSSYPPTRCGLATFTDALASAMTRPDDRSFAVRVIDQTATVEVDGGAIPVAAHLRHGDRASLNGAARTLNRADVAIIQHEYGIYGGPDGDEVIDVLDRLEVPAITVLHTVVMEPTPGQRRVLEAVVERSSAAIVMTLAARALLMRNFDVDPTKVEVIPHGVHPMPALQQPFLPMPTRPTILTWGLIGPGKGIEWGIRALAHLRDLRPHAAYRVVGQTHPKVVEREGERYRRGLEAMAADLGVADRVILDGRYQTREDLARAISEADVVLLPYDTTSQVTSGVLQEAVAAGKPVVATAFPHAIELLRTGCGIIVPHHDSRAMAFALRAILTRADLAADMSRIARHISRETSWAAVGERYRILASRLLHATVAA
jgi:glycosyltransferase involved in cell wall biosynthesis